MKIIGHTASGYIAEIAPEEIAAISGKPEDSNHQSYARYGKYSAASHGVGSTFNVCDTWKHLQALLKNEGERNAVAESLRAAATLIQHTPSPLTPAPESVE